MNERQKRRALLIYGHDKLQHAENRPTYIGGDDLIKEVHPVQWERDTSLFAPVKDTRNGIKKMGLPTKEEDEKRPLLDKNGKVVTREMVYTSIMKHHGIMDDVIIDLNLPSYQQFANWYNTNMPKEQIQEFFIERILAKASKILVKYIEEENLEAAEFAIKYLGKNRLYQDKPLVQIAQKVVDQSVAEKEIKDLFGINQNVVDAEIVDIKEGDKNVEENTGQTVQSSGYISTVPEENVSGSIEV